MQAIPSDEYEAIKSDAKRDIAAQRPPQVQEVAKPEPVSADSKLEDYDTGATQGKMLAEAAKEEEAEKVETKACALRARVDMWESRLA